MLLIILTPMILVQIVTVLIFYERHWDTVTRYMAGNLSSDIHVIVDRFAADQSQEGFDETSAFAGRYFYFNLDWHQKGILPRIENAPYTYASEMLRQSLDSKLSHPFELDLHRHDDLVSIHIQFPGGVLEIKSSRKRIFSSTSWLVILWTVSTSIFLFAIALLFLRGQVRPIRRLAKAARQLGLGRPAPDYRLEGAREVRLAGRAFQAMHQRIQRQLVERTEMLAQVSHDLRTPLTRMKLQLQYIPESEDKTGLEKDISEMESMITGYIDFANSAMAEQIETRSVTEIVRDSISGFNLPDDVLKMVTPDAKVPEIALRPRLIRRAVDNLIGNAIRFGTHTEVRIEYDHEQIQILIDDDGPGIPKEHRISVLRPFVRLNSGNDSSGDGLGLSIANDAALSHGGLLLLGDSPMGGLRARLQLPI